MAKAAIPKGTRDFGPKQMLGRNFIFDTLKSVFQTFGFQPIETPAMERLETLTGKYGEEGDRLIFKLLSRGEKLSIFVAFILNGTLYVNEYDIIQNI